MQESTELCEVEFTIITLSYNMIQATGQNKLCNYHVITKNGIAE